MAGESVEIKPALSHGPPWSIAAVECELLMDRREEQDVYNEDKSSEYCCAIARQASLKGDG